MKKILGLFGAAGFYLALNFSNPALAQNFTVVHWINNAGQDGATALNTNGVFITDFKAHNDLTVTRLTADPVAASWDTFDSPPGNNPAYLTNFVGAASNGTGDGTSGYLVDLNMTADATGTLQFDFVSPLTPQDRVLMIDVDGPEQYLVQAYVLNGSSYVSANLTGWKAENFSGSTGVTPDSTWPTWNPNTGVLASATSADVNEYLVALTPDQNINRLVITKQSGSTWSSDITFISVLATAPALTIHKSGTNVVLNWDNPVFNLCAAPFLTGTYATVPNATSPYTNAITGLQKFFRLRFN